MKKLSFLFVLHFYGYLCGMETPSYQKIIQTHQAFEKASVVYLKSSEGTLLPLPRHLLSQEFSERIKELYKNTPRQATLLSIESNKIIIDCSNYSSATLKVVLTLLAREAALKMVKHKENEKAAYVPHAVQAYIDEHADEESKIEKAQELLKVLKLMGLSKRFFSAVCQACLSSIECEEEELFYSLEDLYQSIREENIKSLSMTPAPPSTEEYFVRRELEAQLNPSPVNRRQSAFNMLVKYASKDPTQTYKPIMDQKSWQDLEILCGPKSSTNSYFATVIDKTSTELGKVMLYSKLLQPSTDSVALEKERTIIKTFIDNNELFENLQTLFQRLTANPALENNILSFWADSDVFVEWLNSTGNCLPQFKEFTQWLSTNEVAVEILSELQIPMLVLANKIKQKLEPTTSAAQKKATAKGKQLSISMVNQVSKVRKKFSIPLEGFEDVLESGIETVSDILGCLFSSIQPLIENVLIDQSTSALSYKPEGSLPKKAGAQFLNMALNPFIACGISCMLAGGCPEKLKVEIEARLCIHKKLVLLAQYLSILKELDQIATKFPELKELIPSLASLNIEQEFGLEENNNKKNVLVQFWDTFKSSTHFNHFLGNLHAEAFKTDQNSPSLPFLTAKILTTYRLAHMHKDKLLNAITALSELDMYFSLAQLYKSHEGTNTAFCFPTYTQADTPSIVLEDFWNPFVGAQAVTNTLKLGVDNKPQNVIITGPNAGGKSTLMRSLIFSLLMGQSLGLAPAKKLTFTPFSSIQAYLNITDNAAKGQSLFQVSTQRARQLLERAKKFTDAELFSLTLFDEIYNGTKPDIAESLAFSTLKSFSTIPYNVCICTTHFPCVHQLQKETANSFDYYKLAPQDDPVNHHKMLPGIYTESNGFQLAEEAGLPDDLIEEAKRYHEKNFEEEEL
jgi:hypothetical protein